MQTWERETGSKIKRFALCCVLMRNTARSRLRDLKSRVLYAGHAGSSLSRTFQVGVFASALLVSFVIVGAFHIVRSAEIAQLEQRLKRQRDRQAEIAAVESENRLYQQLLKDLESRLEVIQDLQSRRTGPVQFMTDLSKMVNLATGVDVYTAKFEGQRLALSGQARSLDSVSKFLVLLKRSDKFWDVQLRPFYQDSPLYKFDLDFIYSPTGPAPPPKK